MEAVLAAQLFFVFAHTVVRGGVIAFEVRVQRVHADAAILSRDKPDHIDPDAWRPLIMSFQKFYGLAEGQLRDSRLASIPERSYRSPDVERARGTMAIADAA